VDDFTFHPKRLEFLPDILPEDIRVVAGNRLTHDRNDVADAHVPTPLQIVQPEGGRHVDLAVGLLLQGEGDCTTDGPIDRHHQAQSVPGRDTVGGRAAG